MENEYQFKIENWMEELEESNKNINETLKDMILRITKMIKFLEDENT